MKFNNGGASFASLYMKKDFISITDAGKSLDALIARAVRLKSELRQHRGHLISRPLKNRQLAMIFEKSSTRTRVSFEVAMSQLGGNAIFLNSKDIQLGRGETVGDTARVLSRYVDCIVYRANSNSLMNELASSSAVPVINALDDVEHPCQALADMMTVKEHFGRLKGLRFAYVGDGNNVCNSLMLASAMSGMHFIAATPKGYEPPQRISQLAASIAIENKSRIEVVNDPEVAARKANVLYTDVWVSMGQESEREEKEKLFQRYQINSSLLSLSDRRSIVMHCLPAHRGMEITDEVLDGERSAVMDQAENRLHTEKALLLWLLGRR